MKNCRGWWRGDDVIPNYSRMHLNILLETLEVCGLSESTHRSTQERNTAPMWEHFLDRPRYTNDLQWNEESYLRYLGAIYSYVIAVVVSELQEGAFACLSRVDHYT
jgi:hypothetical protein